MKKLIFLFAMVFAVSMVMAQNSGNIATIDQYGTNLAEVEQTGNNNTADVDQGTLLSPKTNIPLTGYYGAGSYVRQIGNSNNAIVTVTGGSVGSRVDQGGDDNQATQLLGANSSYRGQQVNNYDGRMSIEIIQINNENEGYQKTTSNFGTYGIKKMWIDQTGLNNYGSQHSKGGTQSVMTIKQIGDNNGNAVYADVSSTGLSSPLALGFELGNEAYTQYQNGNFSTATIDITGSDNKTTQAQQYTAWINRAGENTATIDIVGNGNAVIQGQLGELNGSYVDINGDGNIVTTSQLGDNNAIDVDIVGSSVDCVVGVEQVGNLHSATVFQSGASNFAKVIQQ